MKKENPNHKLDRLLGQPIQTNDNGFTRQVCSQLQESETKRNRLFYLLGVSCLLLLLLIDIPENLLALATAFESTALRFVTTLFQALPIFDSSISEVFADIPLLSTLAISLLILFLTVKVLEE